MREAIEKVIADLESRLKSVEQIEQSTDHAKQGRELLENMFASGAKESLIYAISELRAAIAH